MKKNLPLLLIGVVCLAIALFAGWQLIDILTEYQQGADTYEDLSQYATTPTPAVTDDSHNRQTSDTQEQTSDTTREDILWPEVDFAALKAINEDVVGWIYLADTHVNYPIVQGSDNEYYLNRLYDRTGNGAGSIFMDYRNAGNFADRNSILYGHRMNNGTMFADISKYSNQTFWNEHPYMLIVTPDAKYKLEIFSAYIADTSYSAWDLEFDGDDMYANWLQSLKSKSYFDRDMQLTAQDRVVTLSTCTYEFEEARFVVHGILREVK